MFEITSCLLLLLAVVTVPSQAQFEDSISAASLGGAPVGVYDKKTYPVDSWPRRGPYSPFLLIPDLPFRPQTFDSVFDEALGQGRIPRCRFRVTSRGCEECEQGEQGCNAIRTGDGGCSRSCAVD